MINGLPSAAGTTSPGSRPTSCRSAGRLHQIALIIREYNGGFPEGGVQTGFDGTSCVGDVIAFVAGHVTYEIAQAAAVRSPDRAAAEARYLAPVATDGHHPELAEALSSPGRPLTPEATFTRFLNRLIDGLGAG